MPKNLERRQKTGFFSDPNRGWAKMGTTPFLAKIHLLQKCEKTEITTLFEQLLLPKLLPCRFISTFIYKQREKNGIKY